ncbi:hypothetical protein [Limimonas halophila]|nr:hypothetical protein [Limimonas halophila]
MCAAGLALAGCNQIPDDEHDKGVDKSREQFKQLLENPPPVPDERGRQRSAPAVPELSPAEPEADTPELFPNPRVSVSVTEKVPIKDVLFQLAQQAGVDIQIDPRITGGIIFSANDTPFLKVVERISRQAGLRYSVKDNVVRVRVDTPYMKTYNISYITQTRETQSQVSISTQLSTGAVGEGGAQGGDTSSSTTISGEASSNVYAQLETGLRTVLANTAPRGLRQQQQGEGSPVVITPQSGTLSVFGTSKQHEAVQSYLRRVRRAISAQVLIQAKIIEVDLNRTFQSGINWNAVADQLTASVNFSNLATSAAGTATSGLSTLTFNGDNFNAVLNLLGQFGTTRTLSSPRVTVLNNQSAILKVAENEVFFELDAEEEEDEETNQTTLEVDSEIRTVPVGLVMNVRPAIDLRENRVTLTLRPTVSRVDRFVEDPAVAIISERLTGTGTDITSQIPVVETREIDSVLDMRSGQTAIMGGLMQERTSNEDSGVPGLSQIPWIGRAFKQRNENTDMVELVILLNAQIVRNARPDAADSRIYQDYTRDPRRIPMPGSGSGSRQ